MRRLFNWPARPCWAYRDTVRFLVVIFLLAAIRVPAQVETNGTIRVDVQQVIVPVVVVDKKGHHVDSLTKDDFEIREDGVLQSIVFFSAPRQKGSQPSIAAGRNAEAAGSNENPTETYLFVVDALHSSFASFGHVRDTLRSYLEHERDTDAEYGIAVLGRAATMYGNYTRDFSRLSAILRSREFQASIQDAEGQGLEADAAQLKRMLESYCQECPCGALAPKGMELRRDTPVKCVEKKQAIRQFVSASAERTRILTTMFITGLQSLIQKLAELPRRRILVLFSDGFTLFPGRELYGMIAAYFPKDSEWQVADGDVEKQLEPVLSAAAQFNVVVSCVDSRGVYYSTGGNTGAFEGNSYGSSARGAAISAEMERQTISVGVENISGMQQLSRASGGVFVASSNNLREQLQRIIEDGRRYYILAYTPAVRTDGKFHAITVHVQTPGVSVRAKAGYWAAK